VDNVVANSTAPEAHLKSGSQNQKTITGTGTFNINGLPSQMSGVNSATGFNVAVIAAVPGVVSKLDAEVVLNPN
jgi:hypothetical protein